MAKEFGQKKESSLEPFSWAVTLIHKMSRQIGHDYDIVGMIIEEFTDLKKKRLSQLTDEEIFAFLESYKKVYERERPNVIRAIDLGCAPGKHPQKLSDLIDSMPKMINPKPTD